MSGDFLSSPLMVRLQGYDLKALESMGHLLAVRCGINGQQKKV